MSLLINFFSNEFLKRSFNFIVEFNVCPKSFATKAIYSFLVIVTTYIIYIKYYCE